MTTRNSSRRYSASSRRTRALIQGVEQVRGRFGDRTYALSGSATEVFCSVEDGVYRAGFLGPEDGIDVTQPVLSVVLAYGVDIDVNWRLVFFDDLDLPYRVVYKRRRPNSTTEVFLTPAADGLTPSV